VHFIIIYYFLLACVHLNSTRLDANAVCIVYCIFIYTSIMLLEHTPVSILLLQGLANSCIVYIKLPAVSDTLTIHSSEARDVSVHVFLYLVLPDGGSDKPKHVG
jgi:hypothetical protein